MKLCQILLTIVLTCAFALGVGATECTVATFVPEVLVFKGVEMVAPRPLADIFGTQARWNTITEVVYLTRVGKNFSCRQDSTSARANNQNCTLPLAPFECAGVLYAPLRQMVEALGGTVTVDAVAAQATVTFADPAQKLVMKLTDLGAIAPATFRDTAPQFYSVSLYGNDRRRLTYNTFEWTTGNLPAFSPDGKQIAYYHDGALCLRAVDGIAEKRLVSVNCPDGCYQPPVFQPDGVGIVYGDTETLQNTATAYMTQPGGELIVSASDPKTTVAVLKSYSLADGTVRTLTTGGAISPRKASYNPDKTKIVFAKEDPPALFLMNADRTGETQLTKARTDYERDSLPAFSPDGASIVFKRSNDLFAMNIDTTNLRRLNPPGTQVIEFTFTPDGKQVLFSARPQGKKNEEVDLSTKITKSTKK